LAKIKLSLNSKPLSLRILARLQQIQYEGMMIASLDTCDPADKRCWTGKPPVVGHCGAFAYSVQRILGGDLVSARDENGERWVFNRLPDGMEVALTYHDPFFPPGPSRKLRPRMGRNKQHEIFYERLRNKLNGHS
jgi:hypothetical protein